MLIILLIFSCQHEIIKGTSAALAGAVRTAEKNLEKCANATGKVLKEQEKYNALEKRPVGRPPDFKRRVALAKEQETKAEVAVENARSKQEEVKKENRKISKVIPSI